MEQKANLSLDDLSINVTEKAHAILDKYSQTHSGINKNSETAPFKTMKDVFLMAVWLGAKKARPRPLEGKRISPFKGQILSHDEQMYLRSIAIGKENSLDVIADPQKVVKIAEEYANVGIWDLDEILSTSSEGALWDLADYFLKELDQG